MSRNRGLRMSMPAVSAALGCVVVTVAGCGSTGAPSGTVTSAASPANRAKDAAAALEFARCMRAHGVSNFPDPNGRGFQFNTGSGINPRSPAFQTAQNACKQYLPNKGRPPVTSAADRQRALAFAKCMRTHGEPNFPDPVVSSPSSRPAGAVVIIDLHGMVFALGPGMTPRSPAFRQAASDCGIKLPGAPKPAS